MTCSNPLSVSCSLGEIKFVSTWSWWINDLYNIRKYQALDKQIQISFNIYLFAQSCLAI